MTLLGAKLSKVAVVLVIVFTVVEILTMVVWLKFAPDRPILAVVVLSLGLTIEHFISAATGVWVAKARLTKAEQDEEV